MYNGHGSISYGADWFRQGFSLDSAADEGVEHRSGQEEELDARREDILSVEMGVGEPDFVATCSFYDRLLHLWSPMNI